MLTVALVPARKGSKGLPGKNTKLFRGWPLWRHAEHVGRVTCDEVYVSTDDPAIMEARPANVILRPPELAQDDTPMIDVLRHFCTVVQCDLIVLLQPTQPLRQVKHVRAALDLMREGVDSVVSVCEIPAHMSPDWACQVGSDGDLYPWSPDYIDGLERITRRQDLIPAHYRDGTVYVLRPENIRAGSMYGSNPHALVIPRSESVTIDTPEDWAQAEAS